MIQKLIPLILIVIMFSCNVENIRRARLNNEPVEHKQSAQADSFLYYQPVALSDPFLDSLTIENDHSQTLNIILIPPASPPASKTRQIEGFRVQIFAGVDSLNVLGEMLRVKEVAEDTVYFFKEGGLYKIQIGDYPYRNDADMKVMDLRKDGINNSWVVQRLINIPVETDSVKELSTTPDSGMPFSIQILVSADLLKVKTMIEQLQSDFLTTAYYEQKDNLYKVFLGKFKTRPEADQLLKSVRENGYKDAWIVNK
jgi:hypothetical protein